MVVGSDDWNAKERKGCKIWGKRHGRLESRAGRRPLSARFFPCLSAVWALDCFSVLRSRQCARQARKKVSPSVHEIPGTKFYNYIFIDIFTYTITKTTPTV